MTKRWWVSALALVAAACGTEGRLTEPVGVAQPGSVLAIGVDPVSGASIETNKDDYVPGEVVHVVGRGWAANETVTLFMTEDPDTHEDVSMDVVADGNGEFSIHYYDVQLHDLGVTFTLTATGSTSNSVAVAVFTDGNPQTPVVIVGQNPNPVAPGSTSSYTVQVPFDGTSSSCTVNLSATPGLSPAWPTPPSGGFFSFSPASVSGAGGQSPTTVLTVTTPDGMSPDTYQFTVSATYSAGAPCQGPGLRTSEQIDLVVASGDEDPPVVSNVAVNPTLTNGTVDVIVTATVSDVALGGSNIKSAEYRIGVGTWTAMSATDGAFDEVTEGVTATIPAATVAGLTNGAHQVCIRGTDAADNTSDGTDCTTLTVDKQAPAVSDIAPQMVAVNTLFDLTAMVSDGGLGGSNITGAEYRIDGGSVTGMVATDGSFNSPTEAVKAANLSFSSPDVHEVCVRGTDAAGNTSAWSCILFAVYDPSAGFVTGGGWIWSLPGAAPDYPSAEGKANFGFVSKYNKGATVPDGNTQFQFKAGDINFHSASYQWLVVAGARAQYKGEGTLNGVAGYAFLLTAIDGQVSGGGGVDKFRIKIWRIADGVIVYDNQMGASDTGDASTELGGGSIVIHTGGKK